MGLRMKSIPFQYTLSGIVFHSHPVLVRLRGSLWLPYLDQTFRYGSEAGLVLFPKGARFLPDLETELLTFPQGKTDDQVDSISQALAYKPGYDATLSWVG